MIAITGANGRLGRTVVKYLQAAAIPHRPLARQAQNGCIAVDYQQASSLAQAFEGVTEIWHLAGGIRGKGQQTPDIINHQLSQLIVTAAQKSAPQAKLLMISSTAVYGDRSNLWVGEDMPPKPNTRYGQSKLDAERVFLDSGLGVQIIRMGTLYGPNVPFMGADRLKSKDLWLPGEGRNYIPMIHIEDAAAGLIHIAKHLPSGHIVHLADSAPLPLSEFYALVSKRLATPNRVRFWSTWVPSYVQHNLAKNSERIHSKINRRPTWTPDTLKLYTASVRVQTTKLCEELGYSLQYPSAKDGILASIPT